jgi:hypothetical protein
MEDPLILMKPLKKTDFSLQVFRKGLNGSQFDFVAVQHQLFWIKMAILLKNNNAVEILDFFLTYLTKFFKLVNSESINPRPLKMMKAYWRINFIVENFGSFDSQIQSEIMSPITPISNGSVTNKSVTKASMAQHLIGSPDKSRGT